MSFLHILKTYVDTAKIFYNFDNINVSLITSIQNIIFVVLKFFVNLSILFIYTYRR